MKKLPKGLTLYKIVDAAYNDDNTGFCLSCGEKSFGVEPDAKNYQCKHCHKNNVFGAAELSIMFS